MGWHAHGRSGRVAFPRVNVVPATPARVAWYAVALVAERRAYVRSIVEFMMCVCGGCCTIGVGWWMAAVAALSSFRMSEQPPLGQAPTGSRAIQGQ